MADYPDATMDAERPTTEPDRYLARVGLDPADARPADLATLRRLQAAHVATVPFETLAITGDPFGDRTGAGVSLDLPDLHEKIVENRRGGFCFELNGLFGWLLAELGYDADRVAAMVLSDDGDPGPPANHHAHLVRLDRPYVVDVGLGTPKMRRPVPLDGAVVADDAGVEWQVVESDRPDVGYAMRTRYPGEEEWTTRYVLDATPRRLSYFAATCDYLATAPESTFTGDPVVSVATERGHLKLRPDELVRVEDGEERTRPVEPGEYHDLLESEFGLRYRSG